MKKRSFALITAIFVMVIIGTLGIYSFYVVSQTIQTVTEKDYSTKLKLYEKSAQELNLLWLSGNANRTINGSTLDINFTANYNFRIINTPIRTRERTSTGGMLERNATVLVDIVGTFTGDTEPRKITKRTIAKP